MFETWRSTSSLVPLLLAACLGGCDMPDTWAPYATSEIGFATFVSCDLSLERLPVGGVYYQLAAPIPAHAAFATVRYFDATTVKSEAVRVIYGDHRGSTWAWVQTTPDPRRCVAAVTVPWSADVNRPYYLPADPAKMKAEYEPLIAPSEEMLAALLITIFAGICLAPFALRAHERGAYFGCLVVHGVITIVIVLIAQVTDAPVSALERALDYYAFFDALPKHGNWLAPLSGVAMTRLVEGPPFPTDLSFSFPTFAWIAGILGAVWVLIHGVPTVMGAYWLFAPAPVEDERRAGEVRRDEPPIEEVIGAFHDALFGGPERQTRRLSGDAEE